MSFHHLMVLLFLAAMWGGSFLFMRVAVGDFGPIPIIQLRVAIAAACLLPFFLWQYHRQSKNNRLKPSEWGHLFVVGVTNSVIPFTLIAFATQFMGAGYAALLNSGTPLWTAFIGIVWLRDKVTPWQWVGMLISVAGMSVLISGQEQAAPNEATIELGLTLFGVSSLPAVWLAVVAITLATVSYGVSANYSKRFVAHLKPMTVSTVSLLLASIAMLPLSIPLWPTENIAYDAWWSVILLGVVCTAICFVLFYRLMGQIGPTKTVSVTFLVPIFGVLWGWWLLQESVTLEMVVGAGVIFAGLLLSLNIVHPHQWKFRKAMGRSVTDTEHKS